MSKQFKVSYYLRSNYTGKTVLNGSPPGKEFSANVFHEWFANRVKPEVQPEIILKPESDISFENNHKNIEYNPFSDLEKAPETNDVFSGRLPC